MEKLLIIFAKNPELGKVKTRLAANIGPKRALEVYNSTLNHVREVTQPLPVDKKIYYSSFIDASDGWDESVFSKNLQEGAELGARMYNAFTAGFAEGYQSICIIGSDCHELNTGVVTEAFEKLQTHDVVLGPAEDGGYYLLGMNRLYAAFFIHKTWSSSHLCAETLADAKRMNLGVYLLPILNDIDEEKDLLVLWK